MIHSPTIRRRILEHNTNRMSHRAIARIFGCSEAEVGDVVKLANAERIVLSGVPVVKGVPLHPVQDPARKLTPQMRLYQALSKEMQSFANETAQKCHVPLTKLFTSNGRKPEDVLCRGCFYYGLSCHFDLGYECIATTCGVSPQVVHRAVRRYCLQVGAPRPSELADTRRAVA
ncbi:hypothetical protein PSE_3022 [Pseudovibrio sp. FO-BEG1]|uniref:hypothetical protein n=1 Tax=Pseudovibrio sp. (strain FO-BEG1) TaxID=911045 RepID=UPI000238D1E3|nr:hypothetical protein [Pseudovibrio sp. FO-BEG1]AEV37530.1 hypothetical protein PSE_3022 [Pseudovibrio sp. FO-BEG1]